MSLILFRSEIDHLTTLLLSRTSDSSVEVEKGKENPNFSDYKAVHNRHEVSDNHPTLVNVAERAAISTPVGRSKVGISLSFWFCYLSSDGFVEFWCCLLIKFIY